MTKCTCDRCGKEINEITPEWSTVSYKIQGIPFNLLNYLLDNDYDLCPDCTKEFKRWMTVDGK